MLEQYGYEKIGIAVVSLTFVTTANAPQDTLSGRTLDIVVITAYLNRNIVRPLAAVHGSYFFFGKKTEVIDLAQIPADITNKTGRQLFAKIPGVFV